MQVKGFRTFGAAAAFSGMLFVGSAGAADKDLPGPIDSVEDLQSVGKMLFKLADTNNDNLISQKEAVDAGNLLAGGFFFRADANGDGTVTKAEADAAREALFAQKPLLRFVFERGKAEVNNQAAQGVAPRPLNLQGIFDSNSDGNLSAPELRQAVQTSVQGLFTVADKNADGQLDPTEVNQGIVEAGRAGIQAAFNAADLDKNGAVSQQEFDRAIINPAHVMFRIMDANNDNQISADELRSGSQVLLREFKAMQVPEPANSIPNQVRQLTAPTGSTPGAPAAGGPATTVAPR
ncbi:EF hand [Aquisphaera giovannonii]|uniref:EF hand n=1 Tax=Aquisphaera giovannonii TaxID=406548 RepID=A0A5B9W063_9BACT|nr:EF-hand domain-containing protein [Aquisphaera giovannonii]QEH33661.1 EF hand [Aquisphaera giovannonii]